MTGDRDEFVSWTEEHLNKQSDEFQQRFRPAMIGLKLAVAGGSIEAH